ncbi:MAG: AMP-binding protein [Deltaproteobacteria bacterium]|nr:AMP-binding protein [Deltaproteobacteria bacterium]
MPATIAPHNQELLLLSQERARHLLQSDPVLSKSVTIPALVSEILGKSKVAIDFVTHACRVYAERPALGYRQPGERHFRTVSYGEVWEQASGLASGWSHSGLVSTEHAVGILGFASPEFVIAELACLYLGAVAVPLQAHMPASDFEYIINEAEISCMVVSWEHLPSILRVLPRCPSVKSLVLIDLATSDHHASDVVRIQKELTDSGSSVRLATINDVIALGASEGVIRPYRPSPDTDPTVTVMYTSGSTGRPKGAVFHERLWAAYWHSSTRLDQGANLPLVYLSFSPLNHIAGRISVLRSFVNGGLIHFTQKSDMSTLFDDFRVARPTTFFLVPRVSTLIYQEFQREVMLLRAEASNLTDVSDIENQVMETMRYNFLGDRLLSVTTGSAPTAPVILDFLKNTFLVPVFNTYGSTEGGIISVDNRLLRPAVEDYKLADVPELDYRTTDKPYPRGELHVKLRHHVRYYLKNAAASAELFDQDGYLRTGDIVEEHGPDELHWIDRKKNILKLSQGEFVSLWRLESIYTGGNGLIDQIFLYGTGMRSYLLAVVVPNSEALAKLDIASSDDVAIKRAVQSEINHIAKIESLFPYEIPRDVIIERSRFTKDEGLVTESGKQIAGKLKARYADELERLYDLHDNQQLLELAKLRAASQDLDLGVKILRAVAATLGLPEHDLDQTHSFASIGGDSMSAVQLSSTLESLCAIKVPVGLILNPHQSIANLIKHLDNMTQTESPDRPGAFNAVHGSTPTEVLAKDLSIERYFTRDELDAGHLAPLTDLPPDPAVLLTGANGFLGRFLALEMALKAHKSRPIYCVVRAPHDAAAKDRFIDSFEGADDSLRNKVTKLVESRRLIPIAGDLMQPKLGWSEDQWQSLTTEVDIVLHNGALVNHAFTYEQLYEPNVLGTAEIVRFAVAKKRKPLTFVSSVGVASYLPRHTVVTEDETASRLFSGVPLLDTYAAGYGTTKWAAEILLEQAASKFNLPVTTVRCGMILSHTKESGQINSNDFFSRLLCGLVYTKLAPASFYTHNSNSEAHFDGLPVNFVAESIASFALKPSAGYSLYHCVNDHQDRVSLDQIVQWVRSAGYDITMIADFDNWYRRFSDRLQQLPSHKRQQSPLPIIYQWEHPINANDEIRFAGANMRSKRAQLGLDETVPHITETFIHKCLRDLHNLELIPGT